jgi:hypothetical protein
MWVSLSRNPRRAERVKQQVHISGSIATLGIVLSSATLATYGHAAACPMGIFSRDFTRLAVPSGAMVSAGSYKSEAATAKLADPIRKTMHPELEAFIDRVVVPILVARYITELGRKKPLNLGATL